MTGVHRDALGEDVGQLGPEHVAALRSATATSSAIATTCASPAVECANRRATSGQIHHLTPSMSQLGSLVGDSLCDQASGHTNASQRSVRAAATVGPVVLSVKKVFAGRGAVDYYLAQTRPGLVDYYVPQHSDERAIEGSGRTLSAPGSSWWGDGAQALDLAGSVERQEFVPLYAAGERPDGQPVGHRFRLPDEVACAKRERLRDASEIDDPYERWAAKHEVRRTGGRPSVAAWDCTFSPVKSVSLLWASGDRHVQEQVWAAQVAAVDAGLDYLERHAAYVRAGRNGVRILDTTGLVVARMNEWTSRTGDMQLHTHCLILNRAKTVEDGRWRALDGRAILAARIGAGAIYNRMLEAELTRRLGVAWRDRPDGLREIDGVDDDLIEAFSTRRRAITARVTEMAEAYRDRHGIDPPRAVVSAMAQHATLTTRPGKRQVGAADALDAWEATARAQGQRLADLPRRVIGRVSATSAASARPTTDQVAAVLDRLAVSGKTTFTRHDLLRAALDVIPPFSSRTEDLQDAARRLAHAAAASAEVVMVSTADPLDVPDELRRRDGTSIYEQPDRQRWTLRATLDRERWLLDIAGEPTGCVVSAPTIEAAVHKHGLSGDQAGAVRDLLGEDRRIGVLVGPAGAGKTRTLRAVVTAWQHDGGDVVGLTVSQSAAEILADQAGVATANVAKWLNETRTERWQLPSGALVIIDEASMIATADLVEVVDQARRAGSRVLLVGDPAQLSAIQVGGAVGLLADRHGAVRLDEVRRFTNAWEAQASLRLRARDPEALAAYAMRGRIHGGTVADIEARLFGAWRVDALAEDGSVDRRRSVLMVVTTNEQAAVLSERAREVLLRSGVVDEGPTIRLRDNVASVGDHIVTRRNNRSLRTSDDRGWVVNGDVWTVVRVHGTGSAFVRRHRDGATVTLPAGYVAEHCHLGYATTAHRAQGMTVDNCHVAVDSDTSHEALYVAATRGRDANHLWVAVDDGRDVVRDPEDLPDPEQVLAAVLRSRDGDRVSAHEMIERDLKGMRSLARLGPIFDDAVRAATDEWLRRHLTAQGVGSAVDDPEWPSLVSRIRQAALDGHDIEPLVDRGLGSRPLDDAESIAGVLHWRIDQLAGVERRSHARRPLVSVPPIDAATAEVARRAGELIHRRWEEIASSLSMTTAPLAWAPGLGPRPSTVNEASAWLHAATAVAAYRERYEVPAHTSMLGPRPGTSRPDARAAWDHARKVADRYLARRLHDLTPEQLRQISADQQAILTNPPGFDPAVLEHAHRKLDRTRRAWSETAGPERAAVAASIGAWRRRIAMLEEAAADQERWRAAAEAAIERLGVVRAAQRTRSLTRR